MRKIFLILMMVLFIAIPINAINYSIWSHNINIEIDADGTAKITENFNLYFSDEANKLEFRNLSLEYGSNLSKWSEFDSTFKSSIGGEKAVNKKINYTEGEESFLQINYELIDPLMVLGKETSLVEEYSIKANYLNSLYDSGLWIIPDNTSLSITLPAGADVKDNIQPQAIISNNGPRKVITWDGYKSSNELYFSYFIWKKIDPIVDINKFTSFLFRTNEGLIILLAFGLLIGLIIFKRKVLAQKIEEFVENNTVIEED